MEVAILQLNKLITLNTKVIIECGSRLLNLEWDKSDYDFMIVVDDLDKVESFNLINWEEKTDLFIYDKNLVPYEGSFFGEKDQNELLQNIGMLQMNFVTYENVLWKNKSFDLKNFLDKIKNDKYIYLKKFLTNRYIYPILTDITQIERYNKDYYHICYISHLIDNTIDLIDWEKIRHIKEHRFSYDDLKYVKHCMEKCHNWLKYEGEKYAKNRSR